jgi:hypothetical protein
MTPTHKAQRVWEERIRVERRRICSGRLQIDDDVDWGGGAEKLCDSRNSVHDASRNHDSFI